MKGEMVTYGKEKETKEKVYQMAGISNQCLDRLSNRNNTNHNR